MEVGERLPGACLASFSLLAPLLDCESYTMRNAVLSMTGSIVGAVLLQDRTDASVKTRNQMLDVLEERILDVSAYTRKQALSVWQTLAERKAIPLRRLTVSKRPMGGGGAGEGGDRMRETGGDARRAAPKPHSSPPLSRCAIAACGAGHCGASRGQEQHGPQAGAPHAHLGHAPQSVW